MKCAEIHEFLPAYVEDRYADLSVRRHLSRCADCRAELEEFETLRSSLSDMRFVQAAPPPHLLTALTSIPHSERHVERVRTHIARNRRAYAGGLAVAVVGAAGAALWRSRRSRLAAA